jgi:hypothetical protein
MTSDRKAHWENIYSTKGEAEVSWFQETPTPSLELLALVGARPTSAIADIGGGASRLVDSLLEAGFEQILSGRRLPVKATSAVCEKFVSAVMSSASCWGTCSHRP